MPILHQKQSGLPADEGNPAHVEPSDWYASHDGADLDSIVTDSAGQDIADALSGANAPDAGNPFATMGDVAGEGGGGGSTVPKVLQWKFAGTSVGSITLDFAPADGHTVLLYCDGFNSGDPSAVSSTNTTWTKIKNVLHGAYYSLWVGVVSGGAGGTVITITHPNAYMSCFAIEVADTLTGTLGTSAEGTAGPIRTPAAPAAGNLVAVFAGADNTTLVVWPFASIPLVGQYYGVVVGVVGYSLGAEVYAYQGVNAGTHMIAEIT
jgi:hypothetical protein